MATSQGYTHPDSRTVWLKGKLNAESAVAVLLTGVATTDYDTPLATASLLAKEVANANGYARQVVSLASMTATWDATNNRVQWSDLSAQFSATGSDISFNSAVLILGGSSTHGNTSGSAWLAIKYPTSQVIAAGAPTPYTIIWRDQWMPQTYNTTGLNQVG